MKAPTTRRLTAKDREVVALLADGRIRNSIEIARELGVTRSRIGVRLDNLRRLQVLRSTSNKWRGRSMNLWSITDQGRAALTESANDRRRAPSGGRTPVARDQVAARHAAHLARQAVMGIEQDLGVPDLTVGGGLR